jgi:hypothetical protein
MDKIETKLSDLLESNSIKVQLTIRTPKLFALRIKVFAYILFAARWLLGLQFLDPDITEHEIGTVMFRAGDALIVRCDKPLSMEVHSRIAAIVKVFAKDAGCGDDPKVLVLDNGMSLSVLRRSSDCVVGMSA